MCNFFICNRRVTKFTPTIELKNKIIVRKFQAKRATVDTKPAVTKLKCVKKATWSFWC